VKIRARPQTDVTGQPDVTGKEEPAEKKPVEKKPGLLAKTKALIKTDKALAKDYFSKRLNTELFTLQATSDIATVGGALVMRSMPVVGNVLNAYNVVADVATAVERTRAVMRHDPLVTTTDLVVDWAGVAIDIAGAIFPPLNWAQVGVIAWDAFQTYQYLGPKHAGVHAAVPAVAT
jgi:hypothetical protein